jgi:hypothetical protein
LKKVQGIKAMAPEYYALVRSYASQDSAVLFSFGLAMLILLGWAIVRRFKIQWLETVYFGQLIIIFAFLLYVLGRYPMQ